MMQAISQTVWRVIETLANNTDNLKSNWCVPPEAGRFLHLLTRIQNATRIVEVGTSIGFSTLHLALGVAENIQNTASETVPQRRDELQAKVFSIDASPERQAIAKQHFEQSGLSPLVEFATGSALDVLKARQVEWENSLDMAFIDARKDEYGDYAKLLYPCLLPGGLLVADNTQSHRHQMQPFLDAFLSQDRRAGEGEQLWDSCELDTASGLLIARKKG